MVLLCCAAHVLKVWRYNQVSRLYVTPSLPLFAERQGNMDISSYKLAYAFENVKRHKGIRV